MSVCRFVRGASDKHSTLRAEVTSHQEVKLLPGRVAPVTEIRQIYKIVFGS